MGRLDLRDVARDEDAALPPRRALTMLELEVLAGAAQGETTKQCAARLHRSAYTIADHRKAVLHKLGARNMAHAIRIAHESGIFDVVDRAGALPINATKRDAFHAKCSAVDKMRELEPRSTKKLMLEQCSEEFGRPITSANDFTQDEARIVLDRLDAMLVGAVAELGDARVLAAITAPGRPA